MIKHHSRVFLILKKKADTNRISIVAAGTSDLNIASEAKEPLNFLVTRLMKFMMLEWLVFGNYEKN